MGLASMDEALALPAVRSRIDAAMAEARKTCARAAGGRRRQGLGAALAEVLTELSQLEAAAGEGALANAALAAAVAAGSDPRSVLARLDAVDRRILDVSSRNIAGFLIQPIIHSVQGGSDRAGDASEVLARSAKMYEGIADSARYQSALIRRAIGELAGASGS